MKLRSIGLAIPTIFVLAGCANLAPESDIPTVDNMFSSSIKTANTAEEHIVTNWQDYITSEKFKKIISTAVENNRDIEIAKTNIELAMEHYQISKVDNLPKVDLVINSSKGETPNRTELLTADIGFNSYEIDFFGKVSNRNKAALNEYKAIVAESKLVEKTIVNKVLLVLNAIAANNEMITKLESIAQNSIESEEIIAKKVEFGISKEADLSNARTISLRAKYDIEVVKNELSINATALNILTGWDVPTELLPKSISDVREGMRVFGFSHNSDQMLSRPDIVMAEKRLEAADANIGVARANFYPSIKLTTSAGVISTDFKNMATSGTWLVRPSIELPIFNSGLNKSKLKVATAERNKLVSEYKKVVEEAFKEVADNINERESIIKQISVFTELLMEQNRSFRLSEEAYKEGIADFLDILSLKKDLYKVEKEFISLKSKEYENLINLYHSISVF